MGLLATAAAFAKPIAKKSRTLTSYLRHLGAFGLLLLAVVDGSPIPTFAGPDILTAILAARHRDPWYFYTAVATTGSVIGAYITFRVARKAGLDYLNRKFGEARVSRALEYFHRWGTGALLFSTAIPFPFPTSAFFAAAGVLDYPARTFLLVVALGRGFRYGVIALIADLYGRRFVLGLLHPGKHPEWWAAIFALALALIAGGMLAVRRMARE